jgi:hypothetical protein
LTVAERNIIISARSRFAPARHHRGGRFDSGGSMSGKAAEATKRITSRKPKAGVAVSLLAAPGEQFLAALAADFNAHGAEAIANFRDADPQSYLALVSSVVPAEPAVPRDPADALSNEELAKAIAILKFVIAAQKQAEEGAGAPATSSAAD